MGFLQNLFGLSSSPVTLEGQTAKAMPLVPQPEPPAPLPKLTVSSAAELAEKSELSSEAQALVTPGQAPEQYIQALERNGQALDATKALAHGMPERESVWWSCQSSQQVAGKLNGAESEALSAAEAWVKNPSSETQAAAAAAAANTDFTGPGGWAAQAAAWAQPVAASGSGEMASSTGSILSSVSSEGAALPQVPTTPGGLAASAVSGSVLLAAGLMNRPPMPAPEKPVFDMPSASLQTPVLEVPQVTPPEIPPVDAKKLSDMLQPFLDLGKDVASGNNTWA